MATKQQRLTEEVRRGVQSGADKRANARQVTVGLPEGDVARGKAFAVRRYWPSPNSQHAPSRPQGRKNSPE